MLAILYTTLSSSTKIIILYNFTVIIHTIRKTSNFSTIQEDCCGFCEGFVVASYLQNNYTCVANIQSIHLSILNGVIHRHS